MSTQSSNIQSSPKNSSSQKSSPEGVIIEKLNVILKNELTAINQYFLHARLLKHLGFMKLADYEYKESIDEMRHADQLVERIFFLNGLPNLQDLGKLFIGENVKEVLEADLRLEKNGLPVLRETAKYCEDHGDYGSSELVESILRGEEEHIDFLQKQLRLIDSMGLDNYLVTIV